METLLAGAARAAITPPVGTLMMGYAPPRPAKSIHDDLTATAVALRQGGRAALIVSVTVTGLDNAQVADLKQRIAGETGIPPENVVLCAIHTHSGPETFAVAGWGSINRDYCQNILAPGVLRAAREAAAHLQPARLGVGTVMSDVGINRRGIDRHGNVYLGQCPWGYYDPVMTVVSLRGQDGIIAHMIHYGAHATAAGINDAVTRDWPGPMIDRLEKEAGGLACFLNGAIGDVGPRLPNGGTIADLPAALALGERAGFDAVRAFRTIKDWREGETLKTVTGPIALPTAPLPPLKEVQERLRAMDPGRLEGLDGLAHARLRNILAEYEKGDPGQPPLAYEQTLVQLGPVAFVPFPFEMFVEMTLRLRQYSPFQHTLCLSNAGGCYGYFPTRDQYPRGGYEVAVARLFNTHALAEDADEAAVSQNLALLEALAAQSA